MDVTYASHAEDELGGVNELLNGGEAVVGKVAATENVNIKLIERGCGGCNILVGHGVEAGALATGVGGDGGNKGLGDMMSICEKYNDMCNNIRIDQRC